MMAHTGLETQGAGVDGPQVVWRFDFGDSFVEIDGGLTDKDKDTSMASKEMLTWGSA